MDERRNSTEAQKGLRFVNNPKLYAVDGHTLGTHNDVVNLVFFQVFDPRQEMLDATAVAGVRLSKKQLEQLRGAIDQALVQLDKKED